jgi:hypothetical protein
MPDGRDRRKYKGGAKCPDQRRKHKTRDGGCFGMDEMKSSALSAAIAFVVFVGAAPAYGQSTGFIYSNGTYTTLSDPLAIGSTTADGINDAGQVAGRTPTLPANRVSFIVTEATAPSASPVLRPPFPTASTTRAR